MRRHFRIADLPYPLKWLFVSPLIGVLAGLFAYALHMAIDLLTRYVLSKFAPIPGLSGNTSLLLPLIVGLGGLISGLFSLLSPEAEGHGTDAAIYAYHKMGGIIRIRTPFTKLIASSFTIGLGGSAGEEGPMAQIGAGIGSALSRLLGLGPSDRRVALAVGLGAGVGAIFKAPLAGAVLAAEILYSHDVETDVLYPALIASAMGYLVYASLTSFKPILEIERHITLRPLDYPLLILLALICGVSATLFAKAFYAIHDLFRSFKIPRALKPLIGGVVTGLIALLSPEVLGIGYDWIRLALSDKLHEGYYLFLLPISKALATIATIATGGSGGLFAPSFVIGSFIGLAYSKALTPLIHDSTPYVIIGMLSFFAAASKAPISSMLFVLEMTRKFELLPIAMICTFIAYFTSGRHGLYRAQVPTRRDSPVHAREYMTPVLALIRVYECELRKGPIAYPDEPIENAIEKMLRHRFTSMPVVDGESRRLLGVVELFSLLNAREGPIRNYVREVPAVTLRDNLLKAWELACRLGYNWVPVLDDEGKFAGLLLLEAMNEAYKRLLRKITS